MAPPDTVGVLVADDDPALRLLCRVNLELEGYRVLEARSGAELERVLDSEQVRVVLLDIHLGRDDGVTIARTLRETRPDIAIAFLTGSAPELPQASRAFAHRVLPKPFTLEELSETVRRLALG